MSWIRGAAHSLAFLLAAGSPLLGSSTALAEDTLFFPLGDLSGQEFRSGATQVSGDGAVTVGAGTSAASGSNGREALLWNVDDGPVALGFLSGGASWSIAWASSQNGDFIAGESSSALAPAAGTGEAFLWQASDDSMTGLGDLTGGSTRSVAYGVSSDGSVVVGSSSSQATGSNGQEAFLWTEEGEMQGLGFLPSGTSNSIARAVSADGTVVVGESGLRTTEAFRWTEETELEGLGDLPGGQENSRANDVSSDGGTIVGGSASGSSTPSLEAFVWTEEEDMQALGDLPGGIYMSEALATSRRGEVIVGVSGGNDGDTAFIWTIDTEMRSLKDVVEDDGVDLGTWLLTSATGVSNDGRVIVGTGINPKGFEEGWVVRLPEAGATSAGLASLLTLAALARHRSPRRTQPMLGK